MAFGGKSHTTRIRVSEKFLSLRFFLIYISAQHRRPTPQRRHPIHRRVRLTHQRHPLTAPRPHPTVQLVPATGMFFLQILKVKIFKASIVLYLFLARLRHRTRLRRRPILLQAPVTVRRRQATVPRLHLTLLLAPVTGSYRKRYNRKILKSLIISLVNF